MRFAFLGILILVVQIAHAEFVLEFGEAGIVGDNSFDAAPNGTFDVQVYLTQTNSESRLSSASTALAIADFTITITGTDVLPTATAFGTGFVDDFSGNTGVSGTTARVAQFESSFLGTSGVTTSADGLDDNSVLLGTITFTVGATASGVFNLQVSQRADFGSLSVANTPFPSPINAANGTGTLTVTAVPEPSSLLFLTAIVGAATVRRRKR